MVKTAVRGIGTRGGVSASGGNGRGGGAGRGKEPAGERGASGGGGSGRGLSVSTGGKGPAPEYIPLGELAAIAASRTAKSRGKGNLTISPPSGSQNRSTTEYRGKGIATACSDKDGGGSSRPMDAGETETPGRKGASSSHDSNVSSRPSPPSHGTHHSTGNESISGTLPRQYPASSFRDQPSPTLRRTNMNLNIQPRQLQLENHVQEEEEDDEGDEEEQDDEDIQPDDIDPEEQDGDDQDAVNGEDVDYDHLLALVMADPGRQSLPYLSEQPQPDRDTIW